MPTTLPRGQDPPPPYDPLDSTYLSIKFTVAEVFSVADQAVPAGIHHDRKVTIKLRMDEYASYFIKDAKTGEYRMGVVEPLGGRREWLRRRFDEQEDPESAFNVRIRREKKPVRSMDELRENLGTG